MGGRGRDRKDLHSGKNEEFQFAQNGRKNRERIEGGVRGEKMVRGAFERWGGILTDEMTPLPAQSIGKEQN